MPLGTQIKRKDIDFLWKLIVDSVDLTYKKAVFFEFIWLTVTWIIYFFLHNDILFSNH